MTDSSFLNKFVFFIICTGQVFILSCGEDNSASTNPEEPSGPSLLVATLVESLAANDAILVDAEGNIYASNFGTWSPTGGAGTSILKISSEGAVDVFAEGLSGPLGITLSSQGNFYAVNDNNGTNGNIIQIMSDGSKNELATIPGWPAGLVSDDNGNLYISNYKNSTIHKLSADGTLSILVDDVRLAGCVGIDMDENGLILTANYDNGIIYSVDLDGTILQIASISDAVSGFGIGYIAYYDGAIYATGIGSHKIFKVEMDGNVSVFAGSGQSTHLDGPLLEAGFKNPNGIAIDKEDKVMYILDWGKPSLRKIELE